MSNSPFYFLNKWFASSIKSGKLVKKNKKYDPCFPYYDASFGVLQQGWSCPYGDSGSRSVPKVGFFSLIQGQLCPQKFVFIAFREVGFFPPIFGRSVTGQGLSQKPACMSIC